MSYVKFEDVKKVYHMGEVSIEANYGREYYVFINQGS